MRFKEPKKLFGLGLFDLLFFVSLTLIIVAIIGASLGFPGHFDNPFIKAYIFLLVIDVYRYWSINRSKTIASRRLGLFCLLIGLTPAIYISLTLFTPGHPWSLPIFKLGDPLWIFFVPTIQFFLFDLQKKRKANKFFLICIVSELLFLFPLWTITWIWLLLCIADTVI